jgi:hypothetical protein
MWPHVYVICACLVFLYVGDLLDKQITKRQEHQTNERKSAGGVVTAQSTAEDPLKMVVKKDRNM